MYQNILVPLDGSTFAETALPHAAALAEKFESKLTLVNVFETPHIYQKTVDQGVLMDIHQTAVREAATYLNAQKAKLEADGLNVQIDFIEGSNITDMLIEAIAESDADLVVMSTHGQGDLLHWHFGSVAQRVARHSPVPIVRVQPNTS